MTGEINPTALAIMLVHIPPLVMMVYLGIWQGARFPHGLSRLTIWGLATALILEWVRRVLHWGGLAFGADLSPVTFSTEWFFAVNVSLTLFMLNIWSERIRRENGSSDESLR